jgi:hypothetical protein
MRIDEAANWIATELELRDIQVDLLVNNAGLGFKRSYADREGAHFRFLRLFTSTQKSAWTTPCRRSRAGNRNGKRSVSRLRESGALDR